jgi:hypothetical protein
MLKATHVPNVERVKLLLNVIIEMLRVFYRVEARPCQYSRGVGRA